jgi:galactokinase
MDMLREFSRAFGDATDVIIASAPGRVNLIGEHTDYNEGYVMPTPIGLRTSAAGRLTGGEEVKLYASNLGELHAFRLNSITPSAEHPWANYIMGVYAELRSMGYSLAGAEMLIHGEVPQGAGLSSSAALEISVIRLLQSLHKLPLTPVEAAYIGKACENRFVGVQSGVMDQFTASLGEQGSALLIDCRSNSYESIKLPAGAAVIATHTGVNRKLDASQYNERVSQCREGVAALNRHGVRASSLRDVSLADLLRHESALPPLIARRCRHVVSENNRVLEAAEALKRGDVERFGALMHESHESLRADYEVSCMELDALVGIAENSGFVYGSRLTGAGFGGCTVTLLPASRVGDYVKLVKAEYPRVAGRNPVFYPVIGGTL